MTNEEKINQSALRRRKLEMLRSEGANPYPNDFRRTDLAAKIIELYHETSDDELVEDDIAVCVAGRLVSRRVMGKASFAHLRDETGEIQIYLQTNNLQDGTYEVFKSFDLGDIVGVKGSVFRTRTKELSIKVQEIRLLVKSLHPPPEKFHGLTDIETKYRYRYLDLIANTESRRVFRMRAATLTSLRAFLDSRGYLEIESPITLPIPGGANARPFVTYHQTLDMQLYLRVAQELAIKRCLVGGFEKVYEMNRNFRNEGLSTVHNPEFTMLEYNEAYLDYVDYMDFTEQMLRHVAKEVTGSARVEYQDVTIDFDEPFLKISLRDVIMRYHEGISDLDCSNITRLREILELLDVKVDQNKSTNGLLLDLFEATVETQLTQPTFITGYPIEASPLSRRNDEDPDIAERFELFIAGMELANGFSELNDAEDQAFRFRQQAEAKATGDDEAMFYDEDYIRALEYGLPPNAGGGIGVDRLVMILTNKTSIRDVLLFPHMRPAKSFQDEQGQ